MANLADYAEVQDTPYADAANHLLSVGWTLLAVKIVETQFRFEPHGEKSFIKKEAQTVYVLGRNRRVRKA